MKLALELPEKRMISGLKSNVELNYINFNRISMYQCTLIGRENLNKVKELIII